jgi:RNA polymerase sigma-70 factor (ECF subfamily)
VIDQARAAWPDLELDEAGFTAHVEERLEGGDAAAVHAGDLWLAYGCATSDSHAVAAFDRELLSQTGLLLGRMQPTPQLIDDVRQALREKLLVAAPGERPRIADYAGRGPLLAWVRVAAVRAALDLLRASGARAAGGDVEPDDLARDEASPELDYLKERYRPQFKAAFQSALRGLDSEQRNVLRLHVVEGLNIDEIGALFKVHRSTVARWIAAARQQVLAGARAELRANLGLSAGEFDSLAGVVRSQLDLSVAKILVKSSG